MTTLIKIDPVTAPLADIQRAVLEAEQQCPDFLHLSVEQDEGACLKCGGPGRVPVFPELRREREGIWSHRDCRNSLGVCQNLLADGKPVKPWVSDCGGLGYVPTRDLEKVADCLRQLGHEGLRVVFIKVSDWWVYVDRGFDGRVYITPQAEGRGVTFEEALWRALLMAMQAQGGYGSQGDGQGRENSARECIWFSPHCLQPSQQAPLFEAGYAT